MYVPVTGANQCVIGVVLALPDAGAERVRTVRAMAGDPLAQVVPPHITLLPPTAVDTDALAAVADHLRWVASRTAPFDVRLREVGTFRPVSPVVYLSLRSGAAQCDLLQARVRDEAGPLARPLSFPFHPHVTLAQGLDDASLDLAATAGAELEISFEAASLDLCRLSPQGLWEEIRSFSFGTSTDLSPLPQFHQHV
ncbi:2'-5' RNA ligase family protein [Actinomyces sp. 2119]|uniref:2'-5' RNA ligase family protein n=1 Tax=Actinomyces sp. 2119 TaxID=2321393 RepID=UPI000E6CF3D6|nr:2'-5' RNA ligase family protein [Actinomyces sp. 2119]RJF41592.1 2'-5' RNA ligase family protein [Actinomyces sp. 2119]